MNKQQLSQHLDAELKIWSQKSFAQLVEELEDVEAYQRGEGGDTTQFEVLLLEKTDAFVHVSISVDDGRFWRSFSLITKGFFVYADGRMEK